MLPHISPPFFKPLSLLGYGSFSYVIKALDLKSNSIVAIKWSRKMGDKMSREFEILMALKGKENVVQILDFFYSIDAKNQIIQNCILEYCDQSLD